MMRDGLCREELVGAGCQPDQGGCAPGQAPTPARKTLLLLGSLLKQNSSFELTKQDQGRISQIMICPTQLGTHASVQVFLLCSVQ